MVVNLDVERSRTTIHQLIFLYGVPMNCQFIVTLCVISSVPWDICCVRTICKLSLKQNSWVPSSFDALSLNGCGAIQIEEIKVKGRCWLSADVKSVDSCCKLEYSVLLTVNSFSYRLDSEIENDRKELNFVLAEYSTASKITVSRGVQGGTWPDGPGDWFAWQQHPAGKAAARNPGYWPQRRDWCFQHPRRGLLITWQVSQRSSLRNCLNFYASYCIWILIRN